MSSNAAQHGTVLDFDIVNTDTVKALQQEAAERADEVLLDSDSAAAEVTETSDL